ncbi:MAG: alpha-amylase family glycosyl hydrolase [Oscillospiraceae bacterium]|nr:alpha-amylase family glycosyl hydrolase [Oscillospiraceae bacterium]
MKEDSIKQYKIFDVDPLLKLYRGDINARMDLYAKTKAVLTRGGELGLSELSNGHLFYGFHRTGDGAGWVYREWAPAADALWLIGDFNGWDASGDCMEKKDAGVWEITLAGAKAEALTHLSRVKVRVASHGKTTDRIPLYIRKVSRDPETGDFCGQIWDPPVPFEWNDGAWMENAAKAAGGTGSRTGDGADGVTGGMTANAAPLIYEAHIGMAQNKEAVGSYAEFEANVLPRVRETGYNAIQLMAVAEHPYYASFGYQISNLFAPSQWFGSPDDLKSLINAAHMMGIAVYMDLVHSHAVMNVYEGINEFDGTARQFFHEGARGTHSAWGTKLFNYGKHEVIHFLLSNIKYWLAEYHFDGFRFDGVTSMIYLDHGLGSSFGHYDMYFSPNTDYEALVYLQLANEMIHAARPGAVTIAEDMSGMPGMCLPIAAGGIGFDYRLSMGVPDFWIRMLKNRSDEQLGIGEMWYELTTRRPGERNIGYCESHDQALVGDKTIIFWLADKDMYDGMSVDSVNLAVDRAVALHKMIRFASFTLAGEGYLNFIGNEFGHPEWIDFPRADNGWSYKYAKRRWDLADRDDLRYRHLLMFDREMLRFGKERGIHRAMDLANLWMDETEKLLAYRKAGLLFLFNFSPGRSFNDFELPLAGEGPYNANYRVAFDSDRPEFGGQGRIAGDVVYEVRELRQGKGGRGISIYSPARTVLVLAEC